MARRPPAFSSIFWGARRLAMMVGWWTGWGIRLGESAAGAPRSPCPVPPPSPLGRPPVRGAHARPDAPPPSLDRPPPPRHRPVAFASPLVRAAPGRRVCRWRPPHRRRRRRRRASDHPPPTRCLTAARSAQPPSMADGAATARSRPDGRGG